MPGPVQVRDVVKTVAVPVTVPGPTVVQQVPGPVRYIEVPGPVQIQYVIQEVEVPGPERVVEVTVPAPAPPTYEPPPKPRLQVTAKPKSITKIYESYKVRDIPTAVKLSCMDGTDDAEYDCRPIQVGEIGLLRDIYLANDLSGGEELMHLINTRGMLALRPITRHSTRRAKLVFCWMSDFKQFSARQEMREKTMSPAVRRIIGALRDLMREPKMWQETFYWCDERNDGILAEPELTELLAWFAKDKPQYSWLHGPESVQEFMRTFDLDGSGTVSTPEFLFHVPIAPTTVPVRFDPRTTAGAREVLAAINRFFGKTNLGALFWVFQAFDADRNGQLSASEIANLIDMLVKNDPQAAKFKGQSKTLAREVVQALDKDGNGNIDMLEFIDFCRPRPGSHMY